MKLPSKPISLRYFALFKFEKTAVCEIKYARILVFDGCAKVNTREIIYRCPILMNYYEVRENVLLQHYLKV